jgi:hypothetical protein
MAARELTDEDVFGAAPQGGMKELSDEEVFGAAAMPAKKPGLIDRARQSMQDFYVGTGQVAGQVAEKLGVGDIDLATLKYLPPEEVSRRKAVFDEAATMLAKERQGDEGIGAELQRAAFNPTSYVGGPLKYAAPLAAGMGTFFRSEAGGKELGERGADAAINAGIARVAAPLVDKGVKAIGKGISKAAQPFQSLGGELGRLAGVLDDAGVDLTPAQKTGSKALRGVETAFSELPLTSGSQAKIAEGQAEQFNKAVLAKAGIDANKAAPEVMLAGKQKLGKGFEAISKRTMVNVDDALLKKLGEIETEATRRLGPDGSKAVNSFIEDVLATGGKIDGDVYQRTRSLLGKMAKGTKDDFVGGLLKDLQGALDDAAQRSLDDTRRVYANSTDVASALDAVTRRLRTDLRALEWTPLRAR